MPSGEVLHLSLWPSPFFFDTPPLLNIVCSVNIVYLYTPPLFQLSYTPFSNMSLSEEIESLKKSVEGNAKLNKSLKNSVTKLWKESLLQKKRITELESHQDVVAHLFVNSCALPCPDSKSKQSIGRNPRHFFFWWLMLASTCGIIFAKILPSYFFLNPKTLIYIILIIFSLFHSLFVFCSLAFGLNQIESFIFSMLYQIRESQTEIFID